jgi:hypothetical protein
MHKLLRLHEKQGIHEYIHREYFRSVSRVNLAVLVLFFNLTTMQLQQRSFSLIFWLVSVFTVVFFFSIIQYMRWIHFQISSISCPSLTHAYYTCPRVTHKTTCFPLVLNFYSHHSMQPRYVSFTEVSGALARQYLTLFMKQAPSGTSMRISLLVHIIS